eukprot:TRINITY_DN1228_c0_g1_i3.p1 TRINITY_DN1228_c0_g1~~TRINITY_DN1228_c0_g1_i3.p1  ORF type:complete len:689 (+),score=38.33 TRINITY_DN1228_c0_g1_i3:293-2068(+)
MISSALLMLPSGKNCKSGLMQLPEALLEKVLRRLHRPKDVVSCAVASKRILQVSVRTPFELDLTQYKCNDQDVLSEVVKSIATYFKGVKSIALADTSIDSQTLGLLLPTQPHESDHTIILDELDCSNCRKIELKSDAWDPGRLKRVNLQRCFRLTSQSLVKLLSFNPQNTLLECAAVSHLQLDRLQEQLNSVLLHNEEALQHLQPAYKHEIRMGNLYNSSLRVLVLNNSTGLNIQSLHAVRIACPSLEYLFLGGSVFSSVIKDMPQQGYGDQYREYATAVTKVVQDTSKTALIELATLLCMWKSLKLIELTFFGSTDFIDSVKNILEKISVNGPQIWNLSEEEDKRSALYLASRCQKEQEHALLMGIRCALCCSSPSKQTLLHLAVMAGNLNEVKMLLKFSQQALLDVKGRYGGTALFRACEMGFVEIVQLLMQAGADPWLKNSGGEVPLYIAALKGQITVVNYMLNHFETVGDQTWQDLQRYGDAWTPLMAAAVGNRLDIVQLLLQACKDIRTFCALQNRYGQTALHIAALRGRLEIVRELISWSECWGLLEVKDSMGRTAVDIAKAHSQMRVVQYLKQHKQIVCGKSQG